MLKFVLLAGLAAGPAASATWAAAPSDTCEPAIAAAERRAQTAPGLLHAIGLVESGRRDARSGQRRPWPWTVTAEGVGTYYPAKADAIAAVALLQARGVTSIDVGCMQVNLQYHPAAFRNLDEAFAPGSNAAYAARFLSSLHDRLGEWPGAAAAYHSMTPTLGGDYAKLVFAVWAGAPVPVAVAGDGSEVVQLPGGGTMRVFRAAGGHGRVFGVLD